MTTSLQSLQHIQSVNLIIWRILEYRQEPSDFPNVQTFYFNDSIRNIDLIVEGIPVVSLGLGPLITYSKTKESIRATGDKVTIGLSGVPDYELQALLASGIKGSEIQINRLIQYPGTNDNIVDLDYARASGGVVGRFFGYVNNYAVNDDIQHTSQTRLVEIVLDCINFSAINIKNVAGIRTNPQDLRFLTNDTDESFDRVPALHEREYFFGESK